MKFTSKVKVRFADIDAMGHVNNAVFLNYFEEARISFFNEMVGEKWDWKNQGIVLARNEIDYLRPILMSDTVAIDTTIEKIGSKSMTLSYLVHNGREGEGKREFAKGLSVIVAFDYSKGKTTEIPDTWKAAFEAR